MSVYIRRVNICVLFHVISLTAVTNHWWNAEQLHAIYNVYLSLSPSHPLSFSSSIPLTLSLPLDVHQFSDNGLVQFQSVSQNEQRLLPAPFPAGFQGNESLALLAVFWDDADLTLGGGQLLYQVSTIPVWLPRSHTPNNNQYAREQTYFCGPRWHVVV